MTSTDFAELGGVRPMSPAGETVFVFGEWVDRGYPLEVRYRLRNHHVGSEARWIVYIYGLELVEQPTYGMMTRLLKLLNIKEPVK